MPNPGVFSPTVIAKEAPIQIVNIAPTQVCRKLIRTERITPQVVDYVELDTFDASTKPTNVERGPW